MTLHKSYSSARRSSWLSFLVTSKLRENEDRERNERKRKTRFGKEAWPLFSAGIAIIYPLTVLSNKGVIDYILFISLFIVIYVLIYTVLSPLAEYGIQKVADFFVHGNFDGGKGNVEDLADEFHSSLINQVYLVSSMLHKLTYKNGEEEFYTFQLFDTIDILRSPIKTLLKIKLHERNSVQTLISEDRYKNTLVVCKNLIEQIKSASEIDSSVSEYVRNEIESLESQFSSLPKPH